MKIRKLFIKVLILSFLLIIFGMKNFVMAQENVTIDVASEVNLNEKFDITLEIPFNAYAAQADVSVIFQDGTIESKKIVYMTEMSEFSNKLTFNANVPGEATINVTNILLSDEDSNYIECNSSITKKIYILDEFTINKEKITLFNLQSFKLVANFNDDSEYIKNVSVEKADLEDASQDNENDGLEKIILNYYNDAVISNEENESNNNLEKNICNIKIDKEAISGTYKLIITSNTNYSVECTLYIPAYNEVTNYKTFLELKKGDEINLSSKIILDSTDNYIDDSMVDFNILEKEDEYTYKVIGVTNNTNIDVGNTIININPYESFAKFSSNTISNTLNSDDFSNLENNDYTYKVFTNNGVEKDLSELIGSKDMICVFLNGKQVNSYIAAVKGDVSGNGKVAIYDAFQILKGTLASSKLEEIDEYIRDFNDDGKVTIYDAFQFLKKALR